ncbi:hypothetical protein M634_24660 [Vibrio parahaemolyticus O1:Kuk str. FDA_R31]|nr:hypothetical protein M634_24660 [Vibrio parahaemolyticus O1:Kuk str. FDA_R31]ETT13634.1 hypothetical protein D028_4554 [Vibrio parahaemolyticus 50]
MVISEVVALFFTFYTLISDELKLKVYYRTTFNSVEFGT